MIRKLRNKFVLINMLLITIVLLITFMAVYISTQQRLINQSMSVLQNTLMRSNQMSPPPNDIRSPEKNPGSMPIPSFAVQLDTENNIIASQGTLFDLSDEKALKETVGLCLASNKDTGVIADAGLRYLKQSTASGLKIAFVDRNFEVNTLTSLVKISILVGIGSLLAFFLISLFLAKWALRPAETAWKKQKQFVADASHELKTPLTVILANAGIVLSNRDQTVNEQAKWLEYIQTEAQRMNTLVENLLFLAKADEERSKPILSKINLSDAVWGAILPFEPVIYEQNKTLNSDITPNLFIKGDEGKIKQLMEILLDNACKYSNDGGEISVRLSRHAEKKVQLSVNNTGIIIPPDQIESIFERFFRLDKSRVREQGGYGLGLSIAQSIALMHNTKISVQSTPKSGTTFTVVFEAKEG